MMDQAVIDRRRWILDALERYEVRLLRFSARLLGDEDAARDAVQHAFLRLCGEQVEKLNGRAGPWLFAVCRNYAVDILRKREKFPQDDRSAADCCSRSPDPAVAAEQADLHGAINRTVNELPVAQREAVLLWSEGFGYREIAEMTGAGEGNVRVMVHRGLKQVRQRWQA
jgi:RNA polymerase sigma factor (sigma-70 family)